MGDRTELNTEIELRNTEIENLKMELARYKHDLLVTQKNFFVVRQQLDILMLEKLDAMIEAHKG